MADFSKTSPYASTPNFGPFLDLLEYRKVVKRADDVLYQISTVYKYRPDLLAYDLYGDTTLWWVFVTRNPNVLKDPIFDFMPGVSIYVPKKTNLMIDLGI